VQTPSFGIFLASAFWRKCRMRHLGHSFASYHLAKHCNASELMLYMGHTSTKQIFEAYRELVLPQAAETYWKIAPPQHETIAQAQVAK
jgi:integrase